MLSRRYLRIKVFQALYAYYQSDDKNLKKVESELFLSIEKMYDLYLMLLILGPELFHQSKLKMEGAKNKMLPTEDDLIPNTKFIDNKVFDLLENNSHLKSLIKEKKLSWSNDQELMIKLNAFLKGHEIYKNYVASKTSSFEEDQKFVVDFYKKIIPDFDLLLSVLQDKSIFWGLEEIDFILSMILKTVKKFTPKSTAFEKLLPLYRDEEEDIQFVKDLLHETIANDKENSKLIADKTKNWDVDRIAMVDIILMKMALSELLYFKSIPIKVTLNEYIELSKWYSSPKSKIFVNGVLDKLVLELKEKGQLKKIGRGLLES
ncbi:MAG: transcription antitermination factor NusB [Bacteroidetes bacterium RIFCSPLOWO2_12_FULL_31_6]|nr:MAG: transcription antitermination factor NusB [Bacteroidetes bacterium RIFCSPLOWO2_12_FULL_31_6]